MTSDLRARIEALAAGWIAADDTTQWGDHTRSRCGSELRALLAEPAAEDDIRAKVERSSLGTPEAQALRATVSDEHAARIVARAKELDTSVPAPAADGGEVGALAALLGEPNQFGSVYVAHAQIREALAEQVLASDWLADLRRTERAEGAREALRIVRLVEGDMAESALNAWRSADARRGLSDHDALLQHADTLTRWSERFRVAFDGEDYREDRAALEAGQ
jgi:hypothetical protein